MEMLEAELGKVSWKERSRELELIRRTISLDVHFYVGFTIFEMSAPFCLFRFLDQ